MEQQPVDPVAEAKAKLEEAKRVAKEAKDAAKALKDAEKAQKAEAARLKKEAADKKKADAVEAKTKREADRAAKKAEREANKANKTPRSHTHVQFVEGGTSEPTQLSTRGLVFRKLKELGTEAPVAVADLSNAVAEALGGEVDLKQFLAKLVMHKHAVMSTPVAEEANEDPAAGQATE